MRMNANYFPSGVIFPQSPSWPVIPRKIEKICYRLGSPRCLKELKVLLYEHLISFIHNSLMTSLLFLAFINSKIVRKNDQYIWLFTCLQKYSRSRCLLFIFYYVVLRWYFSCNSVCRNWIKFSSQSGKVFNIFRLIDGKI
jgi:hypothetical protein